MGFFDNKKYLTFEGGGGKGFAYLGALLAFQNDQIAYTTHVDPYQDYIINVNRVRGIAGASAGSIFAALFGCGVPYNVLYSLIENNYVFKEMERDKTDDRNFNKIPDLGFVTGFDDKKKKNLKFRDVINATTFGLGDAVGKKIEDFALSVNGTFEDFGINTSYNVRNLIHNYIVPWALEYDRVVNRGKKPSLTPSFNAAAPNNFIGYSATSLSGGLTFIEHYKIFGIPLHIASVNTLFFRNGGAPFYFNYKTTPNVNIADAVRCSMSIPIYFKPDRYIADKKDAGYGKQYDDEEKKALLGYWVDGGAVGNVPCTAFQEAGMISKDQLILRLNPPSYENIVNSGKYLEKSLFAMIGNPSELPIRKYGLTKNQIYLNIDGLSTLNFEVDKSKLPTIVDNNKQKVECKLTNEYC